MYLESTRYVGSVEEITIPGVTTPKTETRRRRLNFGSTSKRRGLIDRPESREDKGNRKRQCCESTPTARCRARKVWTPHSCARSSRFRPSSRPQTLVRSCKVGEPPRSSNRRAEVRRRGRPRNAGGGKEENANVGTSAGSVTPGLPGQLLPPEVVLEAVREAAPKVAKVAERAKAVEGKELLLTGK